MAFGRGFGGHARGIYHGRWGPKFVLDPIDFTPPAVRVLTYDTEPWEYRLYGVESLYPEVA